MINKYSLFSKLSLFALQRNKVGKKITEKMPLILKIKNNSENQNFFSFSLYQILSLFFHIGITYCYYVS